MAEAECSTPVDTLIFDIDDTLYPASSGFSDHRNGADVAGAFMVEHLGFATVDEALDVRNEYFKRYHSTLKGLTVATREGRLPRPFVESALGEYWAEHCDFDAFLTRNESFVEDLKKLPESVKLVAFTNAPRKYGLRCLQALGLADLFDSNCVFGVEDVAPHCKPEKEAFEQVLARLGAKFNTAVMVEDSMKNVRACRALGMRTILIKEDAPSRQGEAGLLGDVADGNDPAVDVTLASVNDIRAALPDLWDPERPRFVPLRRRSAPSSSSSPDLTAPAAAATSASIST